MHQHSLGGGPTTIHVMYNTVSRMFKGPQIVSCHKRSWLVGVRDSFYCAYPMALAGNICRRWCTSTGWETLSSSHRGIRVTEGDFTFAKEMLPSVSPTSSLDSGYYLLQAASQKHHKLRPTRSSEPQLPPLTHRKIRLEPRQCSASHYSTQNSKGLGKQCDRSNYMKPPVRILPAHHQRCIFLPKLLASAAQRPAIAHIGHPSQLNQSRALHQASQRQATSHGDCLSLENEQRCRGSLGRNMKLYEAGRGAAQAQGKSQGKWASILVSLCSVQGEPAFLFTLRSSKLKRNKGDVSFAGGKNDPSDKDVVDTALREAQEELGVTVTTENVWGILKPLRETTGMMVAPVLANLGPIEDLTFKPNPEEVEEIFTLSLSHVVDPSNRRYTHFRTGDRYGYTLPVFQNGKHRVWGLTAIALDHALAVIASP